MPTPERAQTVPALRPAGMAPPWLTTRARNSPRPRPPTRAAADPISRTSNRHPSQTADTCPRRRRRGV